MVQHFTHCRINMYCYCCVNVYATWYLLENVVHFPLVVLRTSSLILCLLILQPSFFVEMRMWLISGSKVEALDEIPLSRCGFCICFITLLESKCSNKKLDFRLLLLQWKVFNSTIYSFHIHILAFEWFVITVV